MNRDELRSVQAPLKEKYREDPSAALVTLSAHGSLDDGITCSVQTGRALATAGLHPATGGDGTALCSGDMLLEALAACAGVTLRSVATSMGLDIRGGSVHVEGTSTFAARWLSIARRRLASLRSACRSISTRMPTRRHSTSCSS